MKVSKMPQLTFDGRKILKVSEWYKRKKNLNLNSIWIVEGRNPNYGDSKFHGNFIPEIPQQMMLRFTEKGDVVWDCFAGSGTTIDVGKELGREVIASDLNPVRKDIVQGDARIFNPGKKVDLLILHPPYAGVIKFSEKPDDLSNVQTPEEFLKKFQDVLDNVLEYVKKEKFVVLVCGDVYLRGRLHLLAFRISDMIERRGFKLKIVIIKDFGRNQFSTGIGKFRALKGNYCLFGHEYVLVFQNE